MHACCTDSSRFRTFTHACMQMHNLICMINTVTMLNVGNGIALLLFFLMQFHQMSMNVHWVLITAQGGGSVQYL